MRAKNYKKNEVRQFLLDFKHTFFLETNHAAFHYHKGAYMYRVCS